MLSARPLFASIALAALFVSACSASNDDDGSASTDDSEAALAGNARNIDIGINAGKSDQFDYMNDFFDDPRMVKSGAHLCHTYLAWNVADEAEGVGTASSPDGHRAAFEYWLKEVEGKCDDVLVSFKGKVAGTWPSVDDFGTAFTKFIETKWADETGFRGTFSFTAWNEPNNLADAGDGLGVVIPAHIAAGYFLSAVAACRANGGCKVAAADFASNGNMWNDYEQNCADDTVSEAELCSKKSSINKTNKPSSYFDRYKNFIVNHASDPKFGLEKGFRPAFFAFHGWHDINEYLDSGAKCDSYDNCVTLKLLKSVGGSWQNAKIWDTETGIDQAANDVIIDNDQACGAAFVVRQTAQDKRIERLYITRLHNGAAPIGGALLRDHTLRPAAVVLAERELSFTGKKCR